MIPTTVSSVPSIATVSSTTGNNQSTSNNGQLNSLSTSTSGSITAATTSPASAQTPSLMLGLASLILEGRAVADDEYQPRVTRTTAAAIDTCSQSGSGSGSVSGAGSTIGISLHNYNNFLASTSYGISPSGSGSGSGSGAVGGGRQSPTCRPSTSRAAASYCSSVGSGHVINITTNPYAFNNSSMGGAHARDSSPLYIDPYNNSSTGASASSSAESIHQRWTQKLCQLRQVSPAASLGTTYEQPVAVEAREPELVSLAINESGATDRGEFEIVRRTLLNRASLNTMSGTTSVVGTAGSSAGAGSARSSPGSGSGSENFLLSLQSLATTCLRSGSPSIEQSHGGAVGMGATGAPIGIRFATLSCSPPPQSMYIYRATTPTAATPAHRFIDQPGSGSSCGSGVQSPPPHWSPAVDNNSSTLHTKEIYMRHSTSTGVGLGTGRIPIPGTAVNTTTATTAAAAAATINNTTNVVAAAAMAMAATATTVPKYPQQGPHCDQFLKKMGLAKGEAAEAEDHFCDMSYVNITCSRWRAYCHKMEAIMGRGEQVCIEVYLGPMNHKILLEQWIITQKEKVPPPTMTLPSLCSAIRSQLYFSQISAWCDLIKKSDKTIYDTGRIIFPRPTGAAGDLATPVGSAGGAGGSTSINITPGTSPNSLTLNQLNNALQANRRPRLNIFYRIKSFDSTACFNSKPNVHNFPNVNISENCSISVCLKSLPRINGGIPKIGILMLSTPGTTATITPITTTTKKATANKNKATNAATPSSATPATTTMPSTSSHLVFSTSGTSHALAASNGSANSSGLAAFRNGNSCPQSDDTPRSSHAVRCVVASTAAALSVGAASTAASMPAISGTAQSRVFINSATAGNPPGVGSFSAISAASSASNAAASSTTPAAVSNGKSCGGSAARSSTDAACDSNKHDSRTSCAPKHKCMFFIDEEELAAEDADAEAFGDEYDNTSDTANSTGDSMTSMCAFSTGGNMSHREKQLMKYRKRMLKRDKKHQHHQRKPLSSTSDATGELGATLELQRRQREAKAANGCQPMEEGDADASVCCTATTVTMLQARTSTHIEMISTGTQTPMSSCRQCGYEKTLVCLRCTADGNRRTPQAIDDPTEQDADEMDDSTASSISSNEIIHTPRNKAELLLQAIQRTPKVAAAKHKKEQPRKPCGAKLQNNNHLSGTPLANGKAIVGATVGIGSSNDNTGSGCQVCKRQKTQHNFGNSNEAEVPAATSDHLADEGDADGDDDDDGIGDDTDDDGGKRYEDIAFVADDAKIADTNKLFTVGKEELPATRENVMEEESFLSSTKLTPQIDRCSLSNSSKSTGYQHVTTADHAGGVQVGDSCSRSENRTPPTIITLMQGECFDESQFKTPTNAAGGIKYDSPQQHQSLPRQQGAQKAFQHKQTPKPNLLQLQCNYQDELSHAAIQAAGASGDGFGVTCGNSELSTALTYTTSGSKPYKRDQPGGYNALLLRKGLPKVNLTPIFCNPMPAATGATITSSHSSPIPIHGATNDNTFCFDPTALNHSGNQLQLHHQLVHSSSGNVCASSLTTELNNIPVQKSFSAPTLPNSPSLSPRFAKQAAIYKRRSRHLSDRSDRSSLGSDEQFSDEDLESGGMYSPATSPLKQCARVAAAFGRQPLLGNLEESLLQKRLMPKVEVMGFKVLLGASGGFCPTQLTIPAAAYFYELRGESLSTPYVCDIRLPRKGYSVPRAGTVQATLLNPMGTVVRMFVIPYDMRDMPPLHQTFIRQRILAEASTNEATTQNVQQAGNNVAQHNGSSDGMCYTNGFGGAGCGDDILSINSSSSNNNNNNNNNNSDFYQSNNNNNNNAKNKYRLSPSGGLHGESNLGHFISAEHMKRLRYSIHLRFQTSRSGRLSLHTDIRLLISRRTDCDTAAAHAKGVLEAPNDLVTDTVMPTNPKYSARPDQSNSSGSGGGSGSSSTNIIAVAAAATNSTSTIAPPAATSTATTTATTTTTNNSNGSGSSKI